MSTLVKTDGTKKNQKYFNVTNQGSSAFIKASNVLMEPFSMSNRNTDMKSGKKVRMPMNPIGVKPLEKPLPTFVEFCIERNIPINQNEDRYFKK